MADQFLILISSTDMLYSVYCCFVNMWCYAVNPFYVHVCVYYRFSPYIYDRNYQLPIIHQGNTYVILITDYATITHDLILEN